MNVLVAACTTLIAAGPALTTESPPVTVREERPRLFLVDNDLPALRARCRSDPLVRPAYRLARDFAYGQAVQSNLWVAPDELSTILVVYRIEGRDPELLPRARGYIEIFLETDGDSWTRPRMLKALAHAYDWLHDELSRQERLRIAERMQYLVETMRAVYRHSDYNNHVYVERGPIVYAGLALAGDGIADEFARGALVEGRELLQDHFLPTVNQVGANGAGGWHESMGYWSFFAYELAHQIEAWRTSTGENLFPAAAGLRGAGRWLLHATRPHDGSMAPVADINTPAPWGWQETTCLSLLAARFQDGVAQHVALKVPPRHPARAWPWILWLDPTLDAAGPAAQPPAALFSGIGWAATRSSWDTNATWALFTCGDTYAGHQHADQNSFVIARGGDLAVDAGEYGAKATSFHNTVLIGDGQRICGNDPRRFQAPIAPGSELDTGDILAFEENPRFTYVVGDASNAYGAFRDGRRVEPAPGFVRRFIFLKPSIFVVHDLVRLPSETTPVRWLLHSREAPAIAGRRVTIRRGDGELTCETLAPKDARISSELRTGGQRAMQYHHIEVEPESTEETVRFIHVLQTRSRATAEAPAKSELSRAEDGAAALRITTGDRVFRLTLSAGIHGWSDLAVSDAAGSPLLAPRPLAAGVLPHDIAGLALLERWDSAYRGDRRPPWDTGRPSGHLVRALEELGLSSGRAVVLGCGAGTNAIQLAKLGFEVTGIDIAPTALVQARERAQQAGVEVRWLLADVLAPPALEPFGFIFDRGCYHGVRRGNARGYVETVRRLSRPGTRILILAGNANEPPPHYGPPRVRETELRADFAGDFEFEWLRETRLEGRDPTEEGALIWSALLRRRSAE